MKNKNEKTKLGTKFFKYDKRVGLEHTTMQ